MASQNRRTQQNAADETDPLRNLVGATGTFAVMQRQQMAAMADAMGALFRAGESIHHAQLQRDQRASLLHRQAADNLRNATSPMELVSIQSTLAMYEMQEGMRYWQELVAATLKAGGELMRSGAPGPAGVEGTPMEGAGEAAATMAEAFQQMFAFNQKAAPTQH
ncbi:phasin family protein [Ramlibacter humi]|uniref:Phasin domain-containing protein n=1 Tax=Ramlibacter humi TaxID=2530451 RepID=A0A4Z0BR94_9BURK|nr:phasin family protein [Ramlibacter humi]TFZ01837.1 hypothetical protein EZ216_11645 [Ramlibacter humi]